MILSHFAEYDAPITPYSVEQPERSGFKPKGLWVSVDGEDDWESWCRSEEYTIGSHRHRVTLVPDHGVLVLDTPIALLRFTDTYGADSRDGRFGYSYMDFIQWSKVAADYPGIIIAPYQWSLRLDSRTDWYYPWDCASGCIWDASVVAQVKLLDPARAES